MIGKRLCCALAFVAMTAVAHAEMPTASLSAGIHLIQAEVAHTQAARTKGLMYRRQLARNQGMVFVFPEPGRHCMWMRNTFVPLTVAFLDDEGYIVNLSDMQPQTEDLHCAARPVRYALEMSQGWFAERGLGRGARISGLDKLPPAQ
ncbi:MAG: DUF192 domain-containing protein [Pseudomonadota bacterium]